LVDKEGEESVTRRFGDRPTFQVVVGSDGRIRLKQQDPSSRGLEAALRQMLAEN
jgi:hypothetical protein